MKICCTCKVSKELAEFWKSKREKDGLEGQCKNCHKARYKPEMQKIRNAEFRARQPKGYSGEYTKKWRALNPDKDKRLRKKYYQDNKEKCKLATRSWMERNPEKWRVTQARNAAIRRLRLESVGGDNFTEQDIKDIRKKQENKCTCCNVELNVYHIDHIMPIAKFGCNCACNIQLLCPTCNWKKWAHFPFYREAA